MIERPAFKAHLVVKILDEERVVLLSEDTHHLLRGEHYGCLMQLIDGRRTTGEIVQLLRDRQPEAEVLETLDRLKREGYITSANRSLIPREAAFWECMNVDCEAAAKALRQHSVSVISFDQFLANTMADALSALGIPDATDALFSVVLVDDYLKSDLADLNREALDRRRPWMIVKPLGHEIWVGPIFVPGVTGCWACLAHRLKENRWLETRLWGPEYDACVPSTSVATLATTASAAMSLAATEIAKWIVMGKGRTVEHTIWTIDTSSLCTQTHTLTRRPQCPVCSRGRKARRMRPRPVVPKSRPKVFLADGGHRVRPPEATIRALERHVSPITGILHTLRKLSGGEGAHIYAAKYNMALPLSEGTTRRMAGPETVTGKGVTDSQAKASCLAEGVERYSAVFQGNEARLHARYADLVDEAVHPYSVLLFSDHQYQSRTQRNKIFSRFHWIPEPFKEELPLDWTPVWSLTGRETRYLPTAYCYLQYLLPDGHKFCLADTNGCAAGNVVEEAILQAFLELVERDATALWWYSRIQRPAVSLKSFNDPFLATAESLFERWKRKVHILDITSDLGIPSFVAVSYRQDGSQPLFGLGAHLEARLGVSRAVTELAQVLAGHCTQGETEHPIASEEKGDLEKWLELATVENQPHLMPSGARKMCVSDYPRLASDDLHTDIDCCVNILAHRGMEMLVLDLTRPDLAFPAVRVVVPGLRHFWARLGPGRLYDVPVSLGWLDEPLQESQLNPFPWFL